jgi:hypothetical protein
MISLNLVLKLKKTKFNYFSEIWVIIFNYFEVIILTPLSGVLKRYKNNDWSLFLIIFGHYFFLKEFLIIFENYK